MIVIVIRLEYISDEPSENESESVSHDHEDPSLTLDDATEKSLGKSILVIASPKKRQRSAMSRVHRCHMELKLVGENT